MAAASGVYDVIVIGAGIEGSSCAYSLIKEGKSVLMLDQFPLPHTRGSSHGQTRITRYAYQDDFYVRMMVDAFPLWKQLENESGEDFFVNCGCLDIRSDQASADLVVSALSAHDIPHEQLTARQVSQRFPSITVKDSDCAVYDPSGGMIVATRALGAYQKVFKQQGGTIHDNEPVLSVKPGSTTTVVTSRAVYACSNLVIAAGPWAGRFASALGLKLRLQPIRVYPMYWRTKPGMEKAHNTSNFPCFIDSRGGTQSGFSIYGLPMLEYPGLVKVAHHHGPACDPDKRDVQSGDDTWVEQEVTELVRSLFPGLETPPAITERCMYTVTPDQHPYIDQHPTHRNIVIAAGFSGHGFKLAPAIGKAVTEIVLDRAPTYNMKPFRIDRFDAKANL